MRLNSSVFAVALLAGAMTFAPSIAAADTPPASSPGSSSSGGADKASSSGAEAHIPFADHGGIYNWDVIDDKTVLIESQSHEWYKATLMMSCFEMPFAERLGFESNPDGSFDKFSRITARGQSCPLKSLVRTDPPAKKKAKKKDS